MSICDGCNQPMESRPMGAYGGDWITGCNVCEWSSEGDERRRIKQGLTRDELVLHKIDLNNLYNKLCATTQYAIVEELRDIMGILLEVEA